MTDQSDDKTFPAVQPQAARAIDCVILPPACTNDGAGVSLAMGIQQWLAQELASAGCNASAPVFAVPKANTDSKAHALKVFREPWTDPRAREYMQRHADARHGLVCDIHVVSKHLEVAARLLAITGDEFRTADKWAFSASEDLPAKLYDLKQSISARLGLVASGKTWQQTFGTDKAQAIVYFLIGLGNLVVLRHHCCSTDSGLLLAPLVDALQRAPEMDAAMRALNDLVVILTRERPDPLCVQAIFVATQCRKTDQGAWYHLGLLLCRAGDTGTAVVALEEALNLGPQHPAIAATLIDTLFGADDRDNALRVAEFAVKHGNRSAAVLARLGSLLIDNGQFELAEPILRRAIEEDTAPSAFGDLAHVLWHTRETEPARIEAKRAEALDLLARALGGSPLSESTLMMLLVVHESGLVGASGLLLRAAEKHPQDATVLRHVARMYLDGDDPSAARPYLDAILALPRRSRDDEAFARRAILTLSVHDFEARYSCANDAARGEDPTARLAAADFLREVITREPRYWQPYLLLALAMNGSENDSTTLTYLMDAVRLRPDDGEIRDLLAVILRRMGRTKEAVEHLRALVAMNPRAVEPVVSLASCMSDAHLLDEARELCTAALLAIPHHPEFMRILAALPPSGDKVALEAPSGGDPYTSPAAARVSPVALDDLWPSVRLRDPQLVP